MDGFVSRAAGTSPQPRLSVVNNGIFYLNPCAGASGKSLVAEVHPNPNLCEHTVSLQPPLEGPSIHDAVAVPLDGPVSFTLGQAGASDSSMCNGL